MQKSKKIFAFTLAETLITLGIIGIVAAMTIPTIYKNYKVQVLKNQFKAADAIITQALKNTVNELGYDNLNDLNLNYYVSGSNPSEEAKQNLADLNEAWLKQFKGATAVDWHRDIFNRKVFTYSILGQKVSGSLLSGGYLMQNGLFISKISYYTGSAPPTNLQFTFDTNGPYKGPNRAGYDIFRYNSIMFREGCNPVRGISSRESGCYWYAHRNINPSPVQYKETQKNGNYGYTVWFKSDLSPRPNEYWDMLYKPKSYWEK